MGAEVAPDEIVITAGALEALNLALQVVTAPDDVVAIESPSFYGCLQAIENAGRRAVEIPTSAQYGVDLPALERTLERVSVKACWFMTTFQNPLGATMPAAQKEQLVRMLSARGIPLIEDNVYAELFFSRQRPRITKVWDREGLVLDCGSFAKSLAAGLPRLRLGCRGSFRNRTLEAQDHDLHRHQHADPGSHLALPGERRLRPASAGPAPHAGDATGTARHSAAASFPGRVKVGPPRG